MLNMRRLLFLHIIVIYFTFIYTHSHSSHKQTLASASRATNDDNAKTTTETLTDSDAADIDGMSEESRAEFRERFKQQAKDFIFGFKGRPTATKSSKAYVPRAMLDQYLKTREKVRKIIPDDKDFYGKLNIDDLDQTSEEFWTAVYNKHGSYDILIDMDESTGRSTRWKSKMTSNKPKHTAHILPQDNPKDVPAIYEPILPPHSNNMRNRKKFQSVHIKFNLSQEFYSRTSAADDLSGAELHIAREKLTFCDYAGCYDKQLPSTDLEDSNEDSATVNQLPLFPRYQRIYILQIIKYDAHNEPVTRIQQTRRIDTQQTTPLIFDIYTIVKEWLKNPKLNFGIIVRVTNEDDVYEKAIQSIQASEPARFGRSVRTNDSFETPDLNVLKENKVAEHVRLKREFRDHSESDERWLRDQPSMFVISQPTDLARHHTKRDNAAQFNDDQDEMQSDEPDPGHIEPNSSTGLTNAEAESSVTDSSRVVTHTDKSHARHHSSSESTTSRRDSALYASNGNRRNRNENRPSNNRSNTSSQRSKGKSRPSVRQVEKCSKKSMAINFDEVGWSSWIIAPQAYYANYCSGDCSWPLADYQNATNHALIQAIYHSVGRVVPRSCCAPVKLARMTILYQLDGVVQMREYDDMIVEACGCL